MRQLREEEHPLISKAFEYRSDVESGYVYDVRGSLVDIQKNLSRSKELKWVDGGTRFIFIHFTLSNPNLQVFTSLTFRTEFSFTGQISLELRIQSIDLSAISHLFHCHLIILFSLRILIDLSMDLCGYLLDHRSLFDLDRTELILSIEMELFPSMSFID
jgi:hypothetical protein